jgi:hypothetical protein
MPYHLGLQTLPQNPTFDVGVQCVSVKTTRDVGIQCDGNFITCEDVGTQCNILTESHLSDISECDLSSSTITSSGGSMSCDFSSDQSVNDDDINQVCMEILTYLNT